MKVVSVHSHALQELDKERGVPVVSIRQRRKDRRGNNTCESTPHSTFNSVSMTVTVAVLQDNEFTEFLPIPGKHDLVNG